MPEFSWSALWTPLIGWHSCSIFWVKSSRGSWPLAPSRFHSLYHSILPSRSLWLGIYHISKPTNLTIFSLMRTRQRGGNHPSIGTSNPHFVTIYYLVPSLSNGVCPSLSLCLLYRFSTDIVERNNIIRESESESQSDSDSACESEIRGLFASKLENRYKFPPVCVWFSFIVILHICLLFSCWACLNKFAYKYYIRICPSAYLRS